MNGVKFFFQDRKIILRDKTRLKLFIRELFRNEKKPLKSLSYIFCSDNYLLGINREFLKHDFYTDVITFNFSAIEKEIEGEVYISVDRIKDNSKQEGVLMNEELHRVIFHGALHLCGYKDKKREEILSMRSLEEKNLRLYFK